MINKEVLKQIGLSDGEAETYLIVLKLNEALASDVAKRSRISRPHIYDNLNKLVKKSLVTYVIKNNKKYFKVVEPIKLLDYLKEKEENLKTIMPDLQELYKPLEMKTKIEVYEGAEGAKSVLNDILKTRKNIVAFGASDRIRQYLPDFFVERYLREREKRKITARQLFSEKTKVLETKASIFRILPKEFSSPSTTVVYGDKVTIWVWAEIPTIMMIENKGVAKSYRDQFELMWAAAGNIKGKSKSD